MKKYENASIEFVVISSQDVITASKVVDINDMISGKGWMPDPGE